MGFINCQKSFSRDVARFMFVGVRPRLRWFFFCLGALKADRKLLYLMSESDPVCYVERLSR